ncbi:MAG: DUF2919 family protein [Pseudomonadales bacterium]|nr:DUF2919 family protein [Pseudomonadales bacterium]
MYSIDDYDNAGSLKPGGLLIVSTLFVSRFLLFGPLSLLARRTRVGSNNLDLSFFTDVSPFEMLSSIPAFALLVIMLLRNSNSPSWVRLIWRNGRLLLITSVVIQIGLQGFDAFSNSELQFSEFIFVMINCFLLYYLSLSERTRAVFSMFPGESNSTTKT